MFHSLFLFLWLVGCQSSSSSSFSEERSESQQALLDSHPHYLFDDKLLLAHDLFLRGEVRASLERFQEVFKIFPTQVLGERIIMGKLFLGDRKGVKETVQRLMLLDPKNPELHVLSLKVSLDAGDQKAFEKHCEESITLFPNHWDLLDLKIQYLEEKRKRTSALQLTKNFLSQNSDHVGALSVQVDLLFALKRYREALGVVEKLIDLQGDQPKLSTLKGLIGLELNDLDLAAEGFGSALQQDPSLQEVKEIYLKVLQQKSDQQFLDRLVLMASTNQDPRQKQQLLNLVLLALSSRERCQEAMDFYQEEKPLLAHQTALVLSGCHGLLGEVEKGYDLLRSLAQEAPPPLKPLVILKQADLDLMRLRVKDARQRLDSLPDSLWFQAPEFDLAYLNLLSRIDEGQAERFAEKLALAYPRDEWVQFHCVMVNQGLDGVLKQPEKIKSFLKRFPHHGPALNTLAYSYFLSCEDVACVKSHEHLIQKALEQEPDQGVYLDTQAYGFYRQNRLEEALQVAKGISSEKPYDPVKSYHLALILEAKRQWTESFKVFQDLKTFFAFMKSKVPGVIHFRAEWSKIQKQVPLKVKELKKKILDQKT